MPDLRGESLSFDPIHGYIPFTSGTALPADEIGERQLIDHPWLQRLRQIHQLQTAWWVFPTAEHTRFQHVLGVMHLASRAVEALYDSLKDAWLRDRGKPTWRTHPPRPPQSQ
jgi:HD superfamily phosphohydrolase